MKSSGFWAFVLARNLIMPNQCKCIALDINKMNFALFAKAIEKRIPIANIFDDGELMLAKERDWTIRLA